jgi:hypothetical protein
VLEAAPSRVPKGRAIVMPATEQTGGHGTHTLAAVWKHYLVELLEQSGGPSDAAVRAHNASGIYSARFGGARPEPAAGGRMTSLDLGVIGAYLAVVMGIGFYFSGRRRRRGDTSWPDARSDGSPSAPRCSPRTSRAST